MAGNRHSAFLKVRMRTVYRAAQECWSTSAVALASPMRDGSTGVLGWTWNDQKERYSSGKKAGSGYREPFDYRQGRARLK